MKILNSLEKVKLYGGDNGYDFIKKCSDKHIDGYVIKVINLADLYTYVFICINGSFIKAKSVRVRAASLPDSVDKGLEVLFEDIYDTKEWMDINHIKSDLITTYNGDTNSCICTGILNKRY